MIGYLLVFNSGVLVGFVITAFFVGSAGGEK